MKKLVITLALSAASVGVVTYIASKLEKTYYAALPGEAYYSVKNLTINNSSVGDSTRVFVEREVLRTFTGERVATLFRIFDDGYQVICTNKTFRLFVEQSILPVFTDLEWWLNRPTYNPCPSLGPGKYKLSLSWKIILPQLPDKVVHAESNIFTVTP
jgi:hypothetical protein